VPQELKKKQRMPLHSFNRRDAEIHSSGGKIKTNGSNMGEPIKTRRGKSAGRGKHNARLDCVVQVGSNPLI